MFDYKRKDKVMPIAIVVVYLVVGAMYAMNYFRKPLHEKGLLSTENPVAFFFLCLALWPVLFFFQQRYKG